MHKNSQPPKTGQKGPQLLQQIRILKSEMFTPGHGFKDHFVCFFKLEAEVNKKIM